MVDKKKFDADIVSLSQRMLFDILILLKKYKDNFVLVGGWCPYFLLQKYMPDGVDFTHIGSIDIDFAIDRDKINDLAKLYKELEEILIDNEYEIKRNSNNKLIHHRFERKAQNSFVHIDFLVSENSGLKEQAVGNEAQDLFAKCRGIDLAFQNNEKFELFGRTLDNKEVKTDIKIAGAVALIGMKAIALKIEPSRIKDSYDIYSILKFYKQGVISIIEELKPFLKDKNEIITEALVNLSELYSRTTSTGSLHLANFLEPDNVNSTDWNFYCRDAYELVQQLLSGIS